MKFGGIFLMFSLLLMLSFCIRLTSGCNMYHFVRTDDKKALEGHVIKTITERLVVYCWKECTWLLRCFSINVRQTSEGMFECELNNSSKKANQSKMAPRREWSYHEMKGFNQKNCKMHECIRKEDLGDGWRRYGGSAIKLITEKKSWTDARSHCQSLGGDLLSITSSHENDFVNDIFVEDLNLTYIQEDKNISSEEHLYFKLNGNEPEVKLRGPQGHATFTLKGREKALFLKGKNGYAEIPTMNLKPDDFTLCFWISPSLPLKKGNTFRIYKGAGKPITFYFTDGRLRFSGDNTYVGQYSLEGNVWHHLCISWDHVSRLVYYAKNGEYQIKSAKLSSIDIKDGRIQFGTDSHCFFGFMKHLFVSKSNLSSHQIQTIMNWHEQGVWIGLNNPEGSAGFSWSDGTPVSQFMSLPDYNPQPKESGRKCVAMAKDKKWLDKHCDLKYPFLCEKPAPP